MRFLGFYTDPGSGMMLLQLLLASIAGGFYYFRNFFFRLFSREDDIAEANAQSSTSSGK